MQLVCPVGALLACFTVVMLTTGCDDKIERKIGAMTAKSVESQYKVLDDPLLSNWIDTAGHTLVGYSMRQSIPYVFKVLDTDLVNAFAAPYGHIYVTTGLLEFADSEDEVLGVIGHEIGHVVHRHSMSSVKRSFLYNIGLALLGGSSQSMADVAGIGLGLLSLKYSRNNEYEADDMGRKLSFAAMYDPRGNIDFFDKLMQKHEKKKPSSIEVMFRTHPATSDRIARQRAMPELSQGNATALLTAGRGYAQRYQLKRAEDLLAKAAQFSPNDPTTHLALADVQLARGQFAQATKTYETASTLRQGVYAAAGRELAAGSEPTFLATATPQQSARAGALLADATQASKQSGIVVSQAGLRAETIGTSLQPTVAGAHSIIDNLFGLSDLQPDISATSQSVVTYANGVVNQAVEPVYSVERQRENLLRDAETIRGSGAALADCLRAIQQGRAPAEDLAVIQRTLDESRRALDDIRAAITELERAGPAVKTAEQAARDATRYIDRIMRGDDTVSTLRFAQQAAQVTEARALAALAATQKAKKLSQRAAIRALVARINTAAIGTSAQTRENLDGLVAHFTLRPPRDVAQLRASGLGYGDAALVLATVKGTNTKPEELTSAGYGTLSMVDQVTAAGARTDGAQIIMKYLAHALEYETES